MHVAATETETRLSDWRPDTAWFVIVCLCLSFALLITRAQSQCDEGEFALRRRLDQHSLVLQHQAKLPYQEHSFLATQASQWLHNRFGIDLRILFYGISAGGYFCILVATWRWLAFLGYPTSSIVAGIVYVAAMAGCLLPYGLDHPSDTYGPAVFLMALVAAGRKNFLGAVIISLAAGFIWRKNILIAPVLIADALLCRRWREIPWACATGIASLVGPAIYVATIVNQNEHSGLQSLANVLKTAPQWVTYHLAFSGPPLLAVWHVRREVPSLLVATIAVYPAILVAYLLQGLFMFEMRSFWIVVPLFAAYLAAWCKSLIAEESGRLNDESCVTAC